MVTFQHPLADRNLFIVTPSSIHLQSQLADRTVFECQTLDGIVNARASKDESGLFAVADGHVVILHEATRGKSRKYKLKTGNVEYGWSQEGSPADNGTGRATSSLVFARFTHPVFYDYTQ